MDTSTLRPRIEALWERRDALSPSTGGGERARVEAALEALDSGQARVAEPDGQGGWRVNQWLKQAALLSFRLYDPPQMETAAGPYDKVPLKFRAWGPVRIRAACFSASPRRR